jgi:hypothetical protein
VGDADAPTFTEEQRPYRSKFRIMALTEPESLDSTTTGVERLASEGRDPGEQDRNTRADACSALFNARSSSTLTESKMSSVASSKSLTVEYEESGDGTLSVGEMDESALSPRCTSGTLGCGRTPWSRALFVPFMTAGIPLLPREVPIVDGVVVDEGGELFSALLSPNPRSLALPERRSADGGRQLSRPLLLFDEDDTEDG